LTEWVLVEHHYACWKVKSGSVIEVIFALSSTMEWYHNFLYLQTNWG
jgi:hypothetical protein